MFEEYDMEWYFVNSYDILSCVVFFFKQKTAYEIGTGDWSSDVVFRSRAITYKTVLNSIGIMLNFIIIPASAIG